MVLRALLRQHDGELKLLHDSARRPALPRNSAGSLRNCSNNSLARPVSARSPPKRACAANSRDKLDDLALLLEKYAGWLKQHDLQDVNCLLDIATDLRTTAARSGRERRLEIARTGRLESLPTSFVIQHLWLDGFAEMTPQEHALLAAVIPFCREATLAFCLETEPTPTVRGFPSGRPSAKRFNAAASSLQRCPGAKVQTEILRPNPGKAVLRRIPLWTRWRPAGRCPWPPGN